MEIVRKKSTNHRNMCHWALLIWGLLKCCQTTARSLKTTLLLSLMNLQVNPRGLCRRCHLFLGSRRQGFHVTQKCVAGSFENMAMTTTAETAKIVVGIGGMSSLTFCSMRTVGHSVNRRLSSAKGCLSVNFPICSVCQKIVRIQSTFANYSSSGRHPW